MESSKLKIRKFSNIFPCTIPRKIRLFSIWIFAKQLKSHKRLSTLWVNFSQNFSGSAFITMANWRLQCGDRNSCVIAYLSSLRGFAARLLMILSYFDEQ